MIKINKIYTFSILILILTFNSINLFANENYPNTSIAIVDLNLILSESKAAKDATKQFEIIQKNTEEEIIKSDKEMLEERNKLIEQQSVIAP